jgi:hypothetical protein
MTSKNNPFVKNLSSEDIEITSNEENINELNTFLRPTLSDERLDIDDVINLPGIFFNCRICIFKIYPFKVRYNARRAYQSTNRTN